MPQTLDWSKSGLNHAAPVSDWARPGSPRSGSFPAGGWPAAALLLPQGRNGPAFLAFPNFQVLFEWNKSFVYVTAAYFGTRLMGRRPSTLATLAGAERRADEGAAGNWRRAGMTWARSTAFWAKRPARRCRASRNAWACPPMPGPRRGCWTGSEAQGRSCVPRSRISCRIQRCEGAASERTCQISEDRGQRHPSAQVQLQPHRPAHRLGKVVRQQRDQVAARHRPGDAIEGRHAQHHPPLPSIRASAASPSEVKLPAEE